MRKLKRAPVYKALENVPNKIEYLLQMKYLKRSSGDIGSVVNSLGIYFQHEEWVTQTTTLMNFIRTKAKPYIFYLPKTHTEKSKKKLTQSKQVLKGMYSQYLIVLNLKKNYCIFKITP